MSKDDAVDMVHERFRCTQGKGYIITEEDALKVATAKQQIEAMAAQRDRSEENVVILQARVEELELGQTKELLIHWGTVGAISLAWVIAAAEGLADPVFTAIVTLAVCAWGAWNWKWGKVHA